jgi:hypothetical protein
LDANQKAQEEKLDRQELSLTQKLDSASRELNVVATQGLQLEAETRQAVVTSQCLETEMRNRESEREKLQGALSGQEIPVEAFAPIIRRIETLDELISRDSEAKRTAEATIEDCKSRLAQNRFDRGNASEGSRRLETAGSLFVKNEYRWMRNTSNDKEDFAQRRKMNDQKVDKSVVRRHSGNGSQNSKQHCSRTHQTGHAALARPFFDSRRDRS